MIDVAFEALVHASVQASLLLVLLMLARGVLGDRIPARIYCGGWMLAGLRLIIPFTVHTPWGLPTRGVTTAWAMAPASPAADTMTEATMSSGATGFNWALVAGVVWLLGATAMATIFVVRLRRSDRQLATATRPTNPQLLAAWAHVCVGLRRPPVLVLSDHVSTPAVTGLLRPRVVIPEGLQGRLSTHEWESVLQHELAHLRRGDLLQGFVWVLAVALHWPNPLAWLGAALYRRDRELAADALAVARLGGDRSRYGRALVRVVELARPCCRPVAFGAAIGPHGLRRRIVALASERPPRWIPALAMVTVGLLAVVTLSDPRWVTSTIHNGGIEEGGMADGAPPGWFMSGGHASQYRADTDANSHRGDLSARLQPRSQGDGRYATLMQNIPAHSLRGHTVRVSAFVRGASIDGRGDFWARVQAEDSPVDGPGVGAGSCQLSGTFGWRQCEVVLEVPDAGAYLQFGVGLGANGTVWVDDANVELLAG